MNGNDIQINVKTTYIPEQSRPGNQRYVFAYTITIQNQGEEPAQLVSRHWVITDANNKVQEVKGMGVVGQQPRIMPGTEYVYTSGAILETDAGIMEGSYQMRTDAGTTFKAPIPPFALLTPHAVH